MKIIITGSAGYIGGMLVNRFASDPNVSRIVGIDLLPQPSGIKPTDKLSWIQADLAEQTWQPLADALGKPDVVVHCAFKIKNPFGKVKEIERNNCDASRNVFAFSFDREVPKLIYLSSVAAYGAKASNVGKLLAEAAPLEAENNPYGYQKRIVETILTDLMKAENPRTVASVLRLNSVTGPIGQSLGSKLGLITFLRKILPTLIEVSPHWTRQFVHERDVEEAIYVLATSYNQKTNLEIFNLAPNQMLTAKDMGKLLGKGVIHVPAWVMSICISIAWPLTFGKLPIAPGAVDGLKYPINVDGSKIEKTGFHYRFNAADAFLAKTEKALPATTP